MFNWFKNLFRIEYLVIFNFSTVDNFGWGNVYGSIWLFQCISFEDIRIIEKAIKKDKDYVGVTITDILYLKKGF